ncbi:glycosyltransferase [Vibrio chagasii]|uniref:glycosyltransferase n=1 Tax=Vibrio chagasii TaxID=170679 RepID=UPI003DA9EA3F
MFKNHGEARVQCHFLSTIICSLPSLVLFSEKSTLVIEGLGTALYRNEFLRIFFRKIFCFFSFRRVFMNSFERKELGKPSDLVMNGIGINLPNKIPEFKATSGNEEVIKIAYFGRLIKDKGVMDCFKVCDYLLDEGYDFSLDLYGSIYLQNPTSLTSDDIDEIKKKYEGSVNFHGFTNDVMERLNLIDLVVLPSRCEGFPVIVMEANSLGIPCFVYDVPGSRDSVIHGKTGFIADYANVNTMANQIIDYMKLSSGSKKKIFNYCIEISRDNYCRNDKDKLLSEVVLS